MEPSTRESLLQLCRFGSALARSRLVFSPMIDVTFDPRLGRIAEGYGESRMASQSSQRQLWHGYQGETLNSPDTLPVLSSILWLTSL